MNATAHATPLNVLEVGKYANDPTKKTSFSQREERNVRSMSAVSLPLLTPTNYNEHREWHQYYEQVYGERVKAIVDLNSFTWFYHFCPWKPTVWGSGWSDAVDNLPWTLSIDRWLRICNPEYTLAQLGFFVSRKIEKLTFDDGERVEIMRVGDLEFGVAWFYLVKGSGVFITLPNPLRYAVKDKKLLAGDAPFDVDLSDMGVAQELKKSSLNALIFKVKNRLELVLNCPWQIGFCGACVKGMEYSTGRTAPIPIECRDDNVLYWISFILLCALIFLSRGRDNADLALSTLLILSIAPFAVKYRPTRFEMLKR